MQETKSPNFYVRSGIFTLFSLAGAAIGYALYPVMARILTVPEFGDFSAVIAISNQVLGFLMAFNVLSISLVKRYPEDKARANAQTIQKVLIWILLAVSIFIILLSPLLKDSLQINDASSFIVLGLILLISVPGSIWTGYLQGHKEMIRIGWYSLGVAIAKFVGTILLALVGGVLGGLWGFLLGMVAGLIFLRYLPGVNLPGISTVLSRLTMSEKKFIKNTVNYIIISTLVVGSLVALQNIDIFMAKLMFTPEAAGKFAGISVLSNALYYVLFLIIWIVLPEIEIHKPSVNHRVLSTSYKLILAVLVAVVGVELLIGDTVIKFLLGNEFSGQRNIFIYASLFRITLVGITLYGFYLLVIKNYMSLVLAGLAVLSSILISYFYVNTEEELMLCLWLSLLLAITVYWIINIVYRRVGNAKQEI